VRDLLDEKEKAIRASFKEPQRPQRVKNNKLTKERVAAEKDYLAKLKRYAAGDARGEQEARGSPPEVPRPRAAVTRSPCAMCPTPCATPPRLGAHRKVTLPHDYQYTDAKPKSSVEGKATDGP